MLRLGGQTNATCWIDVGSNVASNVVFVWPPLKSTRYAKHSKSIHKYPKSVFAYSAESG